MIRLQDVLAGTGGRVAGEIDESTLFPNVVQDSRLVDAGDLFFAIQGENQDGHRFIPAAGEAGAAAAVVADAWFAVQDEPPIPLIVVPDTLRALRDLAVYWRRMFNPRIVGITGSIGKSSTKEAIAAVAGEKFNVVKSVGSYNNEIGLPLTILKINPDTDVTVLEMGGAYRPGEINELVGIAWPDIGVVTNVTHSHLARMGSLDAIAATKSELVAGLPDDGLAILNGDDERVRAMARQARCRVVFIGIEEGADIRAEDLESRGVEGIRFTLVHGNRRDAVQLPLLGLHSVHTALAAIVVGFELGMALPEIIRGFNAPEVQLRLILMPAINGSTILDDHYNSNPKSCFAALALLNDLDAGRRIAVFGDMLEMGDFEETAHRMVGRRAVDVVDGLFTVGRRSRFLHEEALALKPDLLARHFDDKAALTAGLRAELREGDIVLVKGSRGIQMETVIADLRMPADKDRT